MEEKSYTCVKIDLHTHTVFSGHSNELGGLSRIVNVMESYTSPQKVGKTAERNDCKFVAVTDHNAIEGALIARETYPDRIIPGTEFSVKINNNGSPCIIHVLTIFDPETDFLTHFKNLQSLRGDLIQFTQYCHDNNIIFICAHPFYTSEGEKITIEFLQIIALRFKLIEGINGARFRHYNRLTIDFFSHLTPELIKGWSERFQISPLGDKPWVKHFTSSTDDHTGIFIGLNHTKVWVDEISIPSVLKGISEGRIEPCGGSSDSATLTFQVISIVYKFLVSHIGKENIREKNLSLSILFSALFEREDLQLPTRIEKFRRFLNTCRNGLLDAFNKNGNSKRNMIEEAFNNVLQENRNLKRMFKDKKINKEELVNAAFKLVSNFIDHLIRLLPDNPISFLSTPVSHFLLIPLLHFPFIGSQQSIHKERRIIKEVEGFLEIKDEMRVAWFSEAWFPLLNGVVFVVNDFRNAFIREGIKFRLITSISGSQFEKVEGVRNFEPVRTFRLPEYEDIELGIPSILEILRYIEVKRFNRIVISNPGPLGLIGLLASRLLKIPAFGIYHTRYPQYLDNFFSSDIVTDICWRYMDWFYSQMDKVFFLNEGDRRDFLARGNIKEENTTILKKWFDCERDFNPAHRDEDFFARILNRQDLNGNLKIMYMGRISREKNLDFLVDCYRQLIREMKTHPILIFTGSGAYMKELMDNTRDLPNVLFTGRFDGESRFKAIASADIFAFPSLTDTFGNVVVEAQASGLPAVVMDVSGPREHVIHEKTGYICSDNRDFVEKIKGLAINSELRKGMGRMARHHTLANYNEDNFKIFLREIS